ncbi:hypothetical protein MNBD_BACTEROID05-512 [hydrothermal vent metagenome]|uniref:Lipoprotein n=1 Tax=hydrothermal vent metagenome TaxID=652676 RepID=A0A3B0TNC9_9ZZZZ
MNRLFSLLAVVFFLFSLGGCQTSGAHSKKSVSTVILSGEADWIRNGGAIEFEGKKWVAQDGIESFKDDEVLQMGKYRGIAFFIDKVDVRPFSRLYTEFDTNKYRYYKVK